MQFPNGKAFAFTIFDDTDRATVANVRGVYELLGRLGIRITKSVWPLAPQGPANMPGSTLADPDYLAFVRDLQERGFEIGFHNAAPEDCPRERTAAGLERFIELLGRAPKVHANHLSNRENIYWGAARLRGLGPRTLYRLATLGKRRRFEGHKPDSPYFWGDLCRQHIRYVRNFAFDGLNALAVNPTLPYHDPAKAYVNHWFSSAEGANVDSFCAALAPERLDRLQADGGVCIMYTHLANGFVAGSAVDERFRRCMEGLAERNGWFVPVGELLDYLCEHGPGGRDIPRRELAAMERRWIRQKLRRGTT